MTTTQSAKTTIYYTPVGNKVPLYDGTSMAMTTFAELSNVTTASSTGKAGPAAVAASSCYDLFVWNDAGTVRLTRGPAWTNDTTRSAGTALVRVAGLLLNNASITNGPAASRGTYVGTVRSNASSQLDWITAGSGSGGVALLLSVWNSYNRVNISARTSDTADHTVSSGAWTTGGTPNTNITFVDGLGEDAFAADYSTAIYSATAFGLAGVGFDGAVNSNAIHQWTPASEPGPMIGKLEMQAMGAHTVAAMEYSLGATFLGNLGLSVTSFSSGLSFRHRM